MDKKTFDIINGYNNIANELYFKLEKIVGMDKAEELLTEIDEHTSKLLKLGKYSDESSMVEEEGFLKKEYEGIPMYTKVIVLYRYDSGYSLCETTTDLTLFIPTDLISHETE